MKKHFICAALIAMAFVTAANAQDKPAATEEFKPSGKLWGYVFGDYAFKGHADSAMRNSKNTQYSGAIKNSSGQVVPAMAKNQSNFDFRRIYLGYDYNIAPKISSEFLLAYESLSEDPNAILIYATPVPTPTAAPISGVGSSINGNNDLLVDNRKAMYIKAANIKFKEVFANHDLVIGQYATPSFPLLTEKVWGYRSIERTILDYRYGGSNDMGVTLQGHYMDGRTGYNLMVANGSGPKLEGNVFKKFYGDVFFYIIPKTLVIDVYADYERTALQGSLSPTTGNNTSIYVPLADKKSVSTYKAFIAYTTPKLTVGVETYIQNFENASPKYALSSTSGSAVHNVDAMGFSVYAHATVIENKLRAFGRYDIYNPDMNYSKVDKTIAGNGGYLANTAVATTENFVTAGLDYTPHEKVHIMPNVWYNSYKNRADGPSGAKASDYDLVYRMTFYYIFGK